MERNDLVTGYEGILNRNKLKGSPPGEVITYKLSEEERLKVIKQYGPPLRYQVNGSTIKRAN
ncbi:hypothetical protein [Brevibacillus borstelensis]|uniref:hypothetical protein n=1 Tax=Brevibacillus borstelensis TaxID=45462 RepID=UPI0030C0613F